MGPRQELLVAIRLIDGRGCLARVDSTEHQRLAGAALKTQSRLAKEAEAQAQRQQRAQELVQATLEKQQRRLGKEAEAR